MNLVILFALCIVQFSEEKPTADIDSSTVTIEPEVEDVTIISSTEKPVKKNNSPDVDEPTNVQLPVDLLSDDILLDPSVILSRAEREVLPDYDSVVLDGFDYRSPNVYVVDFVRDPRSFDSEESDVGQRRFTRSLSDDLEGAEDGFIIRPLFKYRHEQEKRANRKLARDRETYRYYPRYPVFPGK